MGKWAQQRRRGGGGSQTVTLQAPVLTFTAPDQLDWVWTLPDPDNWSVQENMSGEIDNVGGASRSSGIAAPGNNYRVIGLDASSNPVTAWSNVVLAT